MSEDLKSMGEVLAEMGFKPRTPRELTADDYAVMVADHWAAQKPKIWPTMLANGVPQKFVVELQRQGFTRETPAILEIERFFRDSGCMILVLSGGFQVGKSFACAYGLSTRSVVLKTQFGNEPWLSYRYVDSDFQWLTASMIGALRDKFDQEIRAKARRLETCGLLVLDELGAAAWDDISKPLEDLLGKRWSANKRTLITTNLSANGPLQQELGARIVERIKRVGRVVEVGGLGEEHAAEARAG